MVDDDQNEAIKSTTNREIFNYYLTRSSTLGRKSCWGEGVVEKGGGMKGMKL